MQTSNTIKTGMFSSLGAKLFYLMTGMIFLTVVSLTIQSTSKFRSFLSQQLQDSLTLQVERSATEISTLLDNWVSQITVTLPTIDVLSIQKSSEQLAKFINANDDYIGIYVISSDVNKAAKVLAYQYSNKVADQRYQNKKVDIVRKKIHDQTINFSTRLLNQEKSKKTVLKSLALETLLPITLLAVKFDVEGSKEPIWVVIACWQTKLLLSLPKSRFTQSFIADEKGNLFLTHDLGQSDIRGYFQNLEITQKSKTSKTPSGYLSEYADSNQQSWVGSYAHVSKYSNISVIIQKDASQAFLVIKKSVVHAALWSALFILLAMFVSYVGASKITRGLREVVQATQNIASGNFSFRINPKSRDEVGALAVSVNHMASRIINLLQGQVEKARFEKELETAKMVQSTFFPKKDVGVENLFVTGFYEPASECGGDLWGHFSVRPGVELVFIADAMGHGAPAALVTAMAYATSYTIADIIKSNPEFQDSPSKILERLNRIIYEAVEGKISMTFWVSVIDFNTGTMTYANAGHNFPFILPSKQDDARLGKKKKESSNSISLVLQGVPLGVDAGAAFKEKTIQCEPGDKIFFFTDGLIECTNPLGKMWGRKTLMERLGSLVALGADQFKQTIIQEANQFFAGHPHVDDITVVVAEIDAKWVKGAQAPNMPPIPTNAVALEQKAVISDANIRTIPLSISKAS